MNLMRALERITRVMRMLTIGIQGGLLVEDGQNGLREAWGWASEFGLKGSVGGKNSARRRERERDKKKDISTFNSTQSKTR